MASPRTSSPSRFASSKIFPIVWELGGHDTATFTSADLVVMSPGVPTLPEMLAARAAGVEVIAEIELAYRLLDPARRSSRSPAPTASPPRRR